MTVYAAMIAMTAVALSGCAGAGLSASHAHSEHADYAGLESREIKALSPEETEGYLSGNGMSFALAAELNGWPGPLHVLEFADAMQLSAEQRAKTERLYAEMLREARALGAQMVAKEKELDALLTGGRADESSLREATEAAARLRGELRFTHLKYHLKMPALLTAEQTAAYQRLRGYRGHGGH